MGSGERKRKSGEEEMGRKGKRGGRGAKSKRVKRAGVARRERERVGKEFDQKRARAREKKSNEKKLKCADVNTLRLGG